MLSDVRAESGQRPFDQEHILPDWLLRRFGLHARTVRLPNQTAIKYGGYKVPMCVECNRSMGRQMESHVRQMLSEGYDHLAKRLQSEGPSVLFAWLAFLYIKTHLRDLWLRFERDQRVASQTIGEFYDWEGLHHVHCLARSIHTGATLGAGVVGSMLVLRSTSTVCQGPGVTR